MWNALIHSVAHPAFLYRFKTLVRQSHHSYTVTQWWCSQLNCLHLWHVLWVQSGGGPRLGRPVPSLLCLGAAQSVAWGLGFLDKQETRYPGCLSLPATEEPLVGTESSHCEGSSGFQDSHGAVGSPEYMGGHRGRQGWSMCRKWGGTAHRYDSCPLADGHPNSMWFLVVSNARRHLEIFP